MSAHTPGHGPGGEEVACVWRNDDFPWRDLPGEANALILGAALDLADALEALLASDGSTGTYDAPALHQAHEAARAALAKAGRLP